MTARCPSIDWLFVALCFILLLPQEAVSQGAVLRGQVIDVESNEPLPGVNVFIDQMSRGTSTDADGYFALEQIPAGSYNVVASMVGYELGELRVEVTPDQAEYELPFKLKALVIELEGIQVEDERPKGWDRQYRRFQEFFIGDSRNARKTTIQNPFVLDFEITESGALVAIASEPLEIINESLGYKIIHVLTEFTLDEKAGILHLYGPSYFAELEPESKRDANRWAANRRETYRGSLQHLLRSMVRGVYVEEGFKLQIDDRVNAPYSVQEPFLKPVAGRGILQRTQQSYLYFLQIPHFLFVDFEEQISWVSMNQSRAILHELGYVYTSPNSRGALTVFGALSSRRMADLLPRDYEPDQ